MTNHFTRSTVVALALAAAIVLVDGGCRVGVGGGGGRFRFGQGSGNDTVDSGFLIVDSGLPDAGPDAGSDEGDDAGDVDAGPRFDPDGGFPPEDGGHRGPPPFDAGP